MTDEIIPLLEQQARAFEEFKRINDERLKAVETKNYAPADLVEKCDKILADMQRLDKEVLDVQKKARFSPASSSELTADQAEHKAAFELFLRTGKDRDLADIQRKAMNTSSDPDGGYLVLPEIDAMIDRIVPTISAMNRLANVVTIGTNRYQKKVKTSGMSLTWVADGSAAGESVAPKYANIDIEAYTAEVEPWVNNETLEDAVIDLSMDLAEEAAISFAEGAGSAFITGNGVGKPFGIMSQPTVANASYAWGKIGYIASGKSAAFASVAPADKIVALQHALKAQYRPGAVWVTNDSTLGTIRQIKDSAGAYYLWQPDPAAAFGGRLLGNPVEVDDNVAAIAANSLSLAFGNFKRGYTIVNRSGTTIIRDNITSKGVTKFNFRRRVGGAVTNYEAIKLMKFATS